MTLVVPRAIRNQVQQDLWTRADEMGWLRLSDAERSAWYERWSKDDRVGGVLAAFMDPRRVRVYIKDALFKPYRRAREVADEARVWEALERNREISCRFEKPTGWVLEDGVVVTWGSATQWKSLIVAAFLRGRNRSPDRAERIALMFARVGMPSSEVIDGAKALADRLGVRPIWLV